MGQKVVKGLFQHQAMVVDTMGFGIVEISICGAAFQGFRDRARHFDIEGEVVDEFPGISCLLV